MLPAGLQGPVDIQNSDKPFGADQFYGNFPSSEDTKTWFAGIQQNLGEKTEADLAYRRHSDLYVLFRDRPSIYTNHHYDETLQLSLRRNETLAPNSTLHYGFEGFHDSIVSNNLGTPARSRGAAYVAADFHALHRFSLSLGAREEMYRSWSGQFCPTAAAGVWLSSAWKLRASTGRAFRVPSYTDLYYSDPANVGNANLRPESAWNYEAGVDWMPSRKVTASATWFDRCEKNGIDYVRATTADRWHAVNFDNLHFTGVEASVTLRPSATGQIDVSYTGLYGAGQALAGLMSAYVFNYPSHAAVVAWRAQVKRDLLLRTRLGVLNRRARTPYALWDIDVGWSGRRVRPFLQWTNLTGTEYEEIAGVAMPGQAIVGGVELVLFSHK